MEETTNTLENSVGSAHIILSEKLNLSNISARWVPKHCVQRTREAFSMEFLNKCDQDLEGFLRQIVTRDETLLYHYDPEDKVQSK